MLTRRILGQPVTPMGIISIASMMVGIILVATFTGCTQEGSVNSSNSGPSISSGATTDPSLDRATGISDAVTDFSSDRSPGSPSTDGPTPGSDSPENVPTITVTSTPSGATVRLNWVHSSDAESLGYQVYYGKQPAQEVGSCAEYETHQAVDAPPATIAGLEPDTIYYFAVKHFNDSDDACSEEMMGATPPAQR